MNKTTTFHQLVWTKVRGHQAASIVQHHDAMLLGSEPVEAWDAALTARADELLAAATAAGTVEAAQAALAARHAAEGAHIISKAVREGVSGRAYRWTETAAHRKVFANLAQAIVDAIPELPPTTSRSEAHIRVSDGARLRQIADQLSRGLAGVSDGFVTSLVRAMALLETMPPAAVVNDPADQRSFAVKPPGSTPPVEPRRWKWSSTERPSFVAAALAQQSP